MRRLLSGDGNTVTVAHSGQEALAAFRDTDVVLLHQELLRQVWGPEYREATEYLRVYVRYLRQKIEKDPAHPQFILTQPSVGYMFSVLGESDGGGEVGKDC